MNFKKQWQMILLTVYNINQSGAKADLNWHITNNLIYTLEILVSCFFGFSLFSNGEKRKLEVKLDT